MINLYRNYLNIQIKTKLEGLLKEFSSKNKIKNEMRDGMVKQVKSLEDKKVNPVEDKKVNKN